MAQQEDRRAGWCRDRKGQRGVGRRSSLFGASRWCGDGEAGGNSRNRSDAFDDHWPGVPTRSVGTRETGRAPCGLGMRALDSMMIATQSVEERRTHAERGYEGFNQVAAPRVNGVPTRSVSTRKTVRSTAHNEPWISAAR
jgi:hypothetical protein